MKILHINAISGQRSTGRICVDIADYLNMNKDEGYIAYSCGLPYKKEYIIGNAIERNLHSLFSRLFGLQAYFSKNGTHKLINYLHKIRPDVVHLHNLHGNYINLELLLTYLAQNNIPTVLTLHDCWFYTGKCCHYTVDKCYKWETECYNCPRIYKDNPSWFMDYTNKMYKDKKELLRKIPRLAVVGVSNWITSEAKKSFLSSAKIVTRIHNWVDPTIFKPVMTDALKHDLGLEKKFIILGVASFWNVAKGLHKFIQLANLISDDINIVLIGRISKNTWLPKNIIHIDETHNVEDLIKYYSLANVLVNLSPEETFGMVTVEALACGTPVIALNSTANPELIGSGCGYVVEVGDIYMIFEKIMNIKKIGKSEYTPNCISHVKKNYAKNDRILDYINLYNMLILENGEF